MMAKAAIPPDILEMFKELLVAELEDPAPSTLTSIVPEFVKVPDVSQFSIAKPAIWTCDILIELDVAEAELSILSDTEQFHC